jgi:hypothetical protein
MSKQRRGIVPPSPEARALVEHYATCDPCLHHLDWTPITVPDSDPPRLTPEAAAWLHHLWDEWDRTARVLEERSSGAGRRWRKTVDRFLAEGRITAEEARLIGGDE